MNIDIIKTSICIFSIAFVSTELFSQIEPPERAAKKIQPKAEILWTKVLTKKDGRYIGWPTIAAKKSGELVAVFSGDREEHVCPFGKLQMVRSLDEGETWSPPQTIADTYLDDRDGGIIELPNGDLLASWFTSVEFNNPYYLKKNPRLNEVSKNIIGNLTKEQIDAGLGSWTIRSSTDGRKWEPRVRTVGSAPHGPILLKDGRLLLVGKVLHNPQGLLTVEESTDNGKSWRKISEIEIPKGNKISHYHEPHAVETDDGRIVALLRYHGDGFMRSSESSDGGKTWSVSAQTKLDGFPAHLMKLRDGRLLASYMRRRGDIGEYAAFSNDGGRTWDVANEIKLAAAYDPDMGYPSSVELPDGSILTVYYQRESADPKSTMSLIGTKWKPRK